jgi:pimeloyl-ACP methyl ester carboxylesterase
MATSSNPERLDDMATETELTKPDLGEDTPKPAARRKRILRRTAITVAALLIVFYGGFGWIFSSKIGNDALDIDTPGEPDYEVAVVAVADGTIVLSLESGDDTILEEGIRGLAWPGGYGKVRDIIGDPGKTVTRVYTPILGTPEVGTLVDVERAAYPSDPLTAHGLEFDPTVTYDTQLGPMGGWYLPGTADSWVILVHGKSAPLRETLRVLPTIAAGGHHALVINYRNDEGMPQDHSGEYGYGATEWSDVESAVRYAIAKGAGDTALIGYSMGGAIVVNFLLESELASQVDAVALDSPMLDFSATVDLGADNSSLPIVGLPVPSSLTTVAKFLAERRFDIDWDMALLTIESQSRRVRNSLQSQARTSNSKSSRTRSTSIHGTSIPIDTRRPWRSS